jgi:Mn2+/Fe2+ NRAMP family transporter
LRKPVNNKSITFKGVYKTLGPGVLYAGAAIGASHLVQSTRAGASYGFALLWAIILINLFKYPFFEFGHRFFAATGSSLIEGYKKLGTGVIYTFFILMICTGVISFAAVTLVTSGLTTYFFKIDISQFYASTILLGIVLIMLFMGRYPLLDRIMKIMIISLTLLTIITFIIAIMNGPQVKPGFTPPELWDKVGIAFIIALMGWMPTPIEASVYPSLWAIERRKQTNYKPRFKEALIDFHVGYLGSAFIAIFFLGLGTFVMYGTGEQFSNSTITFSGQIVSLYSRTLGAWSNPIISAIAMLTMFSTALTVIDAIPRTLAASMQQIFPSLETGGKKLYWVWVMVLTVGALFIIGVMTSSMRKLLDFATIVAFLSAPVFALFNYKVVTSHFMPKHFTPKKWLKYLAWSGIVFLLVFCLLFIGSKILM